MDKKPRKLDVEMIPISDVIPSKANERLHPEENLKFLKKGLDTFDMQKAIVVDEKNEIIAGHGIYAAMKEAGYTHINVTRSDLKKSKKQAYRVFDNKSAELSKWDDEKLGTTLYELHSDGYAVADYGFDESAVTMPKTTEEQDAIEDQVPEVEQNEYGVERGDIWQLGDHRIMCGDSTSEEDVAKLMCGEKADICFTSPPYNVASLNIRGKEKTGKKYRSYDDNKSDDEYRDFLCKNLNSLLINCNEIFYNIGLVQNNKRTIFEIINIFGEQFKDIIYWKKSTVAPHIQKGVINNLVEFIICFGDGKRKFSKPQFSQGSYWNVIEGYNATDNKYSKIHKATFPIYLPENIITNFSEKNAMVIDCFMGSGTTLIACEKTGRKCFGMEIDPHYCSVIIKRWEEYSNKKAEKI